MSLIFINCYATDPLSIQRLLHLPVFFFYKNKKNKLFAKAIIQFMSHPVFYIISLVLLRFAYSIYYHRHHHHQQHHLTSLAAELVLFFFVVVQLLCNNTYMFSSSLLFYFQCFVWVNNVRTR